jgi:hypothetical protein
MLGRIGASVLLGCAIGCAGCANKSLLGDRPGYQEVDTVQTISEAQKAVQWVEVDLEGYEPQSPEAVAARDEVLVQWARVRDRASELQARLDGLTSERTGGRDPRETTDFYQSAEERAEVLRRETSRLLDMWAALNAEFRTPDLGVGSRRPKG